MANRDTFNHSNFCLVKVIERPSLGDSLWVLLKVVLHILQGPMRPPTTFLEYYFSLF